MAVDDGQVLRINQNDLVDLVFDVAPSADFGGVGRDAQCKSSEVEHHS